MDFLYLEWLSKPLWMWLGFIAIVGVLLAFDLGILNRKQREIGVRQSLLLSAGYLALGVGFGGLVWWQLGSTAAVHYLTGFALAVLLIFIGSKIFVADLLGLEKFPAAWSLGVTFAILAAGIFYSLWRTRMPSSAL